MLPRSKPAPSAWGRSPVTPRPALFRKRVERIAPVLASFLAIGLVSTLAWFQFSPARTDVRYLGLVKPSRNVPEGTHRFYVGNMTGWLAYPRGGEVRVWVKGSDGRTAPAWVIPSPTAPDEIWVRIPEGVSRPLEAPVVRLHGRNGDVTTHPIESTIRPTEVQPRFLGKSETWKMVRHKNAITAYAPPSARRSGSAKLILMRTDRAEFEREPISPTSGFAMADGSVLVRLPWANEAKWAEGRYQTVEPFVTEHDLTFYQARLGDAARRNVVTGSPIEVKRIGSVQISLPDASAFKSVKRFDPEQLIVFLRVRDTRFSGLGTRAVGRPGTYLQRLELEWRGGSPTRYGFKKVWLNGLVTESSTPPRPAALGPIDPIKIRVRLFWERLSADRPVRLIPEATEQGALSAQVQKNSAG